MKSKIGDKQRLIHILEAINEIESYIMDVAIEDFMANSMMRFASIKQLEIIGEAANYLSDDIKELYSEVEWNQIIGMRHILVHEYFGIDTTLIWQIIRNDIPVLKKKTEKILELQP